MQGTRACWRLSFSIAAVLGANAAAQVPTVSLKAVKINRKDIAPTDRVNVNPGVTVTAEIFVSHWSACGELLRDYQVTIGVNAITGGDSGGITPLGWDDPRPELPCSTNESCPQGLTCFFLNNRPRFCAGPNHDPVHGAFIDTARSDFVFLGNAVFGTVDVVNYRYAQTLAPPVECPAYGGTPGYSGTLILVVGDDASGTFTVPISPSPNTFLSACDTDLIEPLQKEPLTITVTPVPWRLADADPPNCSIDARQPTGPGGSEPGDSSIALSLGVPDTSGLTAADFSIREVPDSAVLIEPASVSPNDPEAGWITVHFSRPATAGVWTCVKFAPLPGDEACVGGLPGDADRNGIVHADDVRVLIDHLSGRVDPPLDTRQCDIDRSDQCAAADILREIDLLNGAEPHDPWIGRVLPECPSAAPAPLTRLSRHIKTGR